MKRPSGPALAAFACAALLAFLYVRPVLTDVFRTGLDWPVWIDHPEGLIHTNAGKWWVLPPHHYLVDGSSGAFPIYYANLSDTLLNVVAAATGWPVMTIQAVLYGPALAFAFLLLNYVSLAAVLRDRSVALAAGVLVSLGGNATFVDRPEPVSGMSLNTVLHVPFSVLTLGTAQSLGWLLFLPSLALTQLAYRRRSAPLAVAAGLSLGILFHTHTLTFVNAAAAQLAYLVLANALDRPRDARYRLWLGALSATAAGFVILVATRPSVSFPAVVAAGVLALGATFLLDPAKRFYVLVYSTAGLVALPYLLLLSRQAPQVAAVQDAWAQVQRVSVGLPGFFAFFAAYLVGAAVAYAFCRERETLVWVSALLGATAFLALNQYWHWYNHPYRFTIHLLFPLAVLSVLALRDAPRWLGIALGVWLAAIVLFDASGLALGRRGAVAAVFRVAEPERAAFLASVQQVTQAQEAAGVLMLAPAEVSYARGLVQATMLMAYSRVPAFVPDYRFVLWRQRYRNRMGLFCFLFPGYPNLDYPFGDRACEEALEPPAGLVGLREPRLRTSILPVYSIGLAGAPGKPFSIHVKQASARYGWPVLVQAENSVLVRTDAATLPGVARLGRAVSAGGRLAIPVTPDRPGPHLVVLGGRRLESRAPAIALNGHALSGCRHAGNWAVCEADLSAGEHRLELPALDSGPEPEADYLYFAAVVHRDEAARYLTLDGRPPVP
jgi:hypothetical protein